MLVAWCREFLGRRFHVEDSLAHVAAASVKGFPTYGELVASLRVWWADHRPLPLALPPPPPTIDGPRDPTPEERDYVHARVAADHRRVALCRAIEEQPPAPPLRARYLSDGVLDQLNPLPNGRKRVTGAAG